MLDEANSNFINGVVTVLRWAFYLAGAILAVAATMFAIAWAGERIGQMGPKGELEKARRKMRELGYK